MCAKKKSSGQCVYLGGAEERRTLVSIFIPSVNTDDQKGRLLLMVMQTRKKAIIFSLLNNTKMLLKHCVQMFLFISRHTRNYTHFKQFIFPLSSP